MNQSINQSQLDVILNSVNTLIEQLQECLNISGSQLLGLYVATSRNCLKLSAYSELSSQSVRILPHNPFPKTFLS